MIFFAITTESLRGHDSAGTFYEGVKDDDELYFFPKIDIEKDNTLKTSLPWREGIKGRGNQVDDA